MGLQKEPSVQTSIRKRVRVVIIFLYGMCQVKNVEMRISVAPTSYMLPPNC